MKSVVRFLGVAAVCLLAFAARASAQYMYLDVNGDGVNTAADVLAPSTTAVDVWLRTNVNKNGGPAACNTGDGQPNPGDLDINSYEFFLHATGGSLTYGAFTDNMAFGSSFGTFLNATDYYNGRGGSSYLAPGTYKLGTLAISGALTGMTLSIVTSSPVNTFGLTSFGTHCSGSSGTGTYINPDDWQDVDGTHVGAGVNLNPLIVAPATASGSENTAFSVTGSASDPDAGQLVTLSQTNNAPFLTGPASAGPVAAPSITLTGTPNFSQSGSYTVNWSAVDNATPTAGSATASTAVTIANTNRNPALTAPATASGTENTSVSVTGSATDPDGDAVGLSQSNNAPFLPSPTTVGPVVNPSLTVTGTPNFNQSGAYTINWIANDGAGGSGTTATALTIANLNRNPTVTAPATVSGTEGTAVSITGTAGDADAQTVTLSQTNNAPFLAGPASVGPILNPSLTLGGTPSSTQSGSYTINWSAVDTNAPTAGSGTATTALTIADLAVNQNPVITRPATVSGTENTAVSITGSASDPDAGQLVTLSQTNNAAFLTGPASAGPLAAPSITLTGTPNFSQSGSYTVNWTAVDNNSPTAATSTAATAITIANLNRNPAITAPATASGTENTAVSITGSASDPDAQTVTLSQTNNAPFLAGPASAGPVLAPSITLTGTPNFSQSGSYTVNWSAVDTNAPTAGSATATTAVTIANLNRNPAITAPATASGASGASVSVTGSATDPDAQNVTLSQTNNAPFFPASSSNGPSLNPSITLTGTGTTGGFTINWTAVDNNAPTAGTATATTALTVTAGNQAPVITAPATVSGTENTAVSITGSASDPDAGQLVTLSQTNNAAFLTGPASAGPLAAPSITLTGTPNFSQSGSYTVNWTAVDNNSPTAATSTATTAITIANLNRNPAITAPATASGTEGTAVSITGSASDPDADNVTLSQTNNAPFLTGPASAGPSLTPSITLGGTPSSTQSGSYTVNWSAADATTGTAAATTALTIADLTANNPPTLDQPTAMTVNEGDTATQQLTGSDPDNDPLTFSKVGTTPFFMSVSASGLVTLSPGFTDAGSFTGNVQVSDGAATDGKSFAITVIDVNRCPTANPGGPYTGVINVPVSLNGGGSSDPDGDALTYNWVFGDGGSAANGATLTHTYTAAGVYTVSLTVDDTHCTDTKTTTATIGSEFAASAFTTGGNNTTSLGSGKPYTCVQIEPVDGSFSLTDVNLASIKMVSVGTGSVSEIFVDSSKTASDGDKNSNGVTEIRACFRKSDLRLLFGDLPAGRNMVTVEIEGDLVTGGRFRATLDHVVKGTGGALAATVSPNPLNPETTISFKTSNPGRITIKIFDLNGRLVRTLLDEARGAGYQDVRWNGTNGNGVKVSSGVYYFRLDTPDGRIVQAATVLK
jgi:PKD repeat protein